jgi:hypothetical protein
MSRRDRRRAAACALRVWGLRRSLPPSNGSDRRAEERVRTLPAPSLSSRQTAGDRRSREARRRSRHAWSASARAPMCNRPGRAKLDLGGVRASDDHSLRAERASFSLELTPICDRRSIDVAGVVRARRRERYVNHLEAGAERPREAEFPAFDLPATSGIRRAGRCEVAGARDGQPGAHRSARRSRDDRHRCHRVLRAQRPRVERFRTGMRSSLRARAVRASARPATSSGSCAARTASTPRRSPRASCRARSEAPRPVARRSPRRPATPPAADGR